MKKLVTLTIVLTMLLSMVSCIWNDGTEIKLGTSDFSIVVPKGYEKTDDDLDEDQIAYYYKDDQSVDFDVYQWAKGDDYTLESEAEHFASLYGTEPEELTINGIKVMKYVSKEEYEGYEYTVLNYMFEDEESIVELCFWTIDTAEEYAAVDEIINTLKKN